MEFSLTEEQQSYVSTAKAFAEAVAESKSLTSLDGVVDGKHWGKLNKVINVTKEDVDKGVNGAARWTVEIPDWLSGGGDQLGRSEARNVTVNASGLTGTDAGATVARGKQVRRTPRRR